MFSLRELIFGSTDESKSNIFDEDIGIKTDIEAVEDYETFLVDDVEEKRSVFSFFNIFRLLTSVNSFLFSHLYLDGKRFYNVFRINAFDKHSLSEQHF